MIKGRTFLSLFCFFIASVSQAQTMYGVTGAIKTPDACIVDTGKVVLGMAGFRDYHQFPNTLYDQWTVNLNAGIHSRFELGIRLAIFPGEQGDNKIYNAKFDRIFNCKILLVKEGKWPQIAVGMQDIVGTRYHNSTYAVATKNFPSNSFNFQVNVGYGTTINEMIFGEAHQYQFIGVFGSTEIKYKQKISLLAEYDAKDINVGARCYVWKWFNVYGSLLDLSVPLAGVSLKFAI